MTKKIAFGTLLLIIGVVLGLFGNKLSWDNFTTNDISLNIITLIAGLVALFIYFKQNADNKRDAAKILHIEITNAERIMRDAKEKLDQKLASDIALSTEAMPTESWSKYKYLFLRDFDRLEWDLISDFYNKAKLFDQAVNHNKSFFSKNEEQIRFNLENALAEFVKKYPIDVVKIGTNTKEEKKWKDFMKTTEDFYNQFMKRQDLFFYRPDKPVIEAELYLNNTNLQISTTNLGTKLKRLGNIKE